MTRHNNTSGPGGAHFGAFGRPRILRSPEDDDDGGGGGGIVTMTQTEFNQKMKSARLDGERRRTGEATTTAAAPAASPAMTPKAIAEIVAATIAGMAAQTQQTQQTQQPAPPAAAAPGAPSAHTLPTANGVVDLFNLSPMQIRQLGPRGVRENLEKLWGMNDELSGVPRRPKPPTR